MLVLSRHRDEGIVIGDGIEVTVVDIRGDKVRLGITAPPQIQVHRKEIYEDIRQENERASELRNGVLNIVDAEVHHHASTVIPAAMHLDDVSKDDQRRSA